MKQFIFIVLIVLLASNAFCIDPIGFNISAEFGLIPKGHLKMYETNRDIYQNMSIYSDIYFETYFINNIIFIGIDTKVYIWKIKDSYSFHPDYIHFMFTGGLRYKFVDIGFRHYCEHPIIADINNYYQSSIWERVYQEIYIKFDINF